MIQFLKFCFECQLELGIMFLRIFKDKSKTIIARDLCQQQSEGTIGYELYHTLLGCGHDFVPGYENHDTKHILLGYPMCPEGEIKMQTFMFGNAGFSWFSMLSYLSFLIYVPHIWHELPYHYQFGKRTKPIGHLDILHIADKKVADLRIEIGIISAKEEVILQFMQRVAFV